MHYPYTNVVNNLINLIKFTSLPLSTLYFLLWRILVTDLLHWMKIFIAHKKMLWNVKRSFFKQLVLKVQKRSWCWEKSRFMTITKHFKGNELPLTVVLRCTMYIITSHNIVGMFHFLKNLKKIFSNKMLSNEWNF